MDNIISIEGLVGRWTIRPGYGNTKDIFKIIGASKNQLLIIDPFTKTTRARDYGGELIPTEPYMGRIERITYENRQVYIRDYYLHREDGPAYISLIKEFNPKFYLYGTELSVEQYFERLTSEQKEKMIWKMDQLT